MAHLPNQNELTVGELSREIKSTIEDHFGVRRVRGEIQSLSRPSSGHLYFMLADPVDQSRLKAACWRGSVARLTMQPEEGQEVIVTARVSAYPARSEYQLIVSDITLAGIGSLLQMIEQRRKKLEAEGLFDTARKRSLPVLPKKIGVITSEKGAVWQDILHRLEDRFPLHVVLAPVTVQGESAAREVTAALAAFNRLSPDTRPDLLIVARGGGSVEDLMPFNDEHLVRAVAASAIPVISAIGHETDTTLIDHVADLRAPTPTAAAELAVPVREGVRHYLDQMVTKMRQLVSERCDQSRLRLSGSARLLARPERILDTHRQRLDYAGIGLVNSVRHHRERQQQKLESLVLRLLSPRQIVALKAERLHDHHRRLQRARPDLKAHATRLDEAIARLPRAINRLLADSQKQLGHYQKILHGTSIDRTLERGFVLVRDGAGRPMTSKALAAAQPRLNLQFTDGRLDAVPDSGGRDPESGDQQ